jgi:cysteine-rich repeat protein
MQGVSTWGWVRDDLQRIPLKIGETITIEAFDQSTACRKDCTIPRCGDKILDGGEVCDDGNNVDGDGCAANCKSLR